MNLITKLVAKAAKKIAPALEKALILEIETLRKYHKRDPHFSPKDFNSRSPYNCFLGQSFRQQESKQGEEDSDKYRALVGRMRTDAYDTLTDKEEGETLLELWGAQHWTKPQYRKMVMEVYRYIAKKRKTRPKIRFAYVFINVKL